MITVLIKKQNGGKQMNKKNLLMVAGATVIILFIGWFYIDQLSLPESATEKENTIAAKVQNTESKNNVQEQMVNTLQKTDSQGTVAIQATLLPEKSSSNQLVFEIKMNTHSGDLLQYEIDKLAQLTFGSDLNKTGTFVWELANEDSHHLVGYLTWNGEILKESITLKINNIENIPSRTFIWEKDELAAID